MRSLPFTKSDRRTAMRHKRKQSPRGGTRATQKLRQQITKNYRGRVKKMKRP